MSWSKVKKINSNMSRALDQNILDDNMNMVNSFVAGENLTVGDLVNIVNNEAFTVKYESSLTGNPTIGDTTEILNISSGVFLGISGNYVFIISITGLTITIGSLVYLGSVSNPRFAIMDASNFAVSYTIFSSPVHNVTVTPFTISGTTITGGTPIIVYSSNYPAMIGICKSATNKYTCLYRTYGSESHVVIYGRVITLSGGVLTANTQQTVIASSAVSTYDFIDMYYNSDNTCTEIHSNSGTKYLGALAISEPTITLTAGGQIITTNGTAGTTVQINNNKFIIPILISSIETNTMYVQSFITIEKIGTAFSVGYSPYSISSTGLKVSGIYYASSAKLYKFDTDKFIAVWLERDLSNHILTMFNPKCAIVDLTNVTPIIYDTISINTIAQGSGTSPLPFVISTSKLGLLYDDWNTAIIASGLRDNRITLFDILQDYSVSNPTRCVGVALETKNTSEATLVQMEGIVNGFTGLITGSPHYDGVSGEIIGYCISPTKIKLLPLQERL